MLVDADFHQQQYVLYGFIVATGFLHDSLWFIKNAKHAQA
jgi:hypothetical protein